MGTSLKPAAPPAPAAKPTPATPPAKPAAPAAPAAPKGLAKAAADIRGKVADRAAALAAAVTPKPAAAAPAAAAHEGETDEQRTAREAAEAAAVHEGETEEQRVAREAAEAAAAHEGETDEEGTAREAAEAAAAHEGETDEERAAREAEEAAAAGAAELVVELPGARPEDLPMEIVVDDQKTYERLQQLRNDGMRRQEFNRQMETVREREAQVALFDEEIQTDPIGIVLEHMPEALRVDALKALLTDDKALELLLADEDFADSVTWDPAKRALAKSKVLNRRYEIREEGRKRADLVRRNAQWAREVVSAVDRMVPETWNEDQLSQFSDDAQRDVMAYIREHKGQPFDVADLPLVLGRRLRAVGINPIEAAERLARKEGDGKGTRSAAPGKSRAATPPKKPPTAAELKKTASARARAAAIPTGAHGAPVAGEPGIERPPKGSGLAGATAFLNKLRGRGPK